MSAPEGEVTASAECPLSRRVDGKKHSWYWASDGFYVKCHYCGELRDALDGMVITLGRRA
jgi:hypothetical protein